MDLRPLGDTGMHVSAIGFGAFKIGRNEKTKYPQTYALPDEADVARLLNGVLDLGVNMIDTAPAYGNSETRIGQAIAHRRDEYILSTKVGETFADGISTYDFSADAVRQSITRSLQRLRTDRLDIVYVHSNGDDLNIIDHTAVVPTLLALRDEGLVRAIGFSGNTPLGILASLSFADVVMVTYHCEDTSHGEVMQTAVNQGGGVVVKKGLASGNLDPDEALRFVLANDAAHSVVVGSLNLEHIEANVRLAESLEAE